MPNSMPTHFWKRKICRQKDAGGQPSVSRNAGQKKCRQLRPEAKKCRPRSSGIGSTPALKEVGEEIKDPQDFLRFTEEKYAGGSSVRGKKARQICRQIQAEAKECR